MNIAKLNLHRHVSLVQEASVHEMVMVSEDDLSAASRSFTNAYFRQPPPRGATILHLCHILRRHRWRLRRLRLLLRHRRTRVHRHADGGHQADVRLRRHHERHLTWRHRHRSVAGQRLAEGNGCHTTQQGRIRGGGGGGGHPAAGP